MLDMMPMYLPLSACPEPGPTLSSMYVLKRRCTSKSFNASPPSSSPPERETLASSSISPGGAENVLLVGRISVAAEEVESTLSPGRGVRSCCNGTGVRAGLGTAVVLMRGVLGKGIVELGVERGYATPAEAGGMVDRRGKLLVELGGRLCRWSRVSVLVAELLLWTLAALSRPSGNAAVLAPLRRCGGVYIACLVDE